MGEIKKLTDEVVAFRDKRDWQQFHNSKDLAIAVSVEASELLEIFLWKEARHADKNSIKEELADILIYSLQLAHEEDLDIEEIIREKLEKNSKKYPISNSKGNSTKCTDY